MKAEKFLELSDEVFDDLKNEFHKKAFAFNMELLKIDDKKFSEWLTTYFAWSEVGSEEDIASFYWHLEQEEE